MWDDWSKIRKRRGLSARVKFLLQAVLALALLQIVFWQPRADWQPVLAIPFFKGWLVNLGWWWFPFAMLVVVGASNAVNLTDGLDGLAIGPIVMAGGAFAVLAYLTGNFRAADYLKILNVRGAGELTVFCAALIGAAVGFLWFNCHPAEVFMGDAGSLALGAAVGMLAVLTKAELLLPLIGGLYVVEAGSVIVQVASFKATGAPRLSHGAPAPSLRAERVGGAEDRRALLDRLLRPGAAGAHHSEAAVRMERAA